jgi:hypothetical protein
MARSKMVPDTASRKNRNPTEGPVPHSSKAEQQGSADAAMRSGLSELAVLARRALEEKRRKDCLALTSAMLKIDPENQDARVMQSWIRSDLQRENQQAYTLMRSARFTDAREPVEKAGLMLQDVLEIDPENEDAQILFSRVTSMLQGVPRGLEGPPPKPVPLPHTEPPEITEDDVVERPRPRWLRYSFVMICMIALGVGSVVMLTGVNEWRDLLGVNSTVNVVPGTLEITVDEGIRIHLDDKYVGTAPVENLNLKPGVYHLRYELDGADVGSEDVTVISGQTVTNSTHTLLGRLQLLVIPTTGVQVRIDGRTAIPVPEYVDVAAGKHRLNFSASGYESQTISASVAAGDEGKVKAILMPAVPPPPSAPPPPSRSRTPISNTEPVPPVVPGANGFLAISSPFPVDIYMDGRHVGSTPATLELPPGPHTLEYRYNGLSKTMVHVIESKQTTRASIIFE